jgi:hypothetical protein
MSSATLRSSSCRSQGPDWVTHAHSLEWALSRCIPLGASHSRLHSGLRKTSALRTSSSMLRRLTSLLMPSLGWPCTSSWPLPITGALYQFMAIAHYGYLVLKMSSPAGVLIVRGDRSAALAAIEMMGGGTPRLPIPRRLPRCLRGNQLGQTASPSRPSGSGGFLLDHSHRG